MFSQTTEHEKVRGKAKREDNERKSGVQSQREHELGDPEDPDKTFSGKGLPPLRYSTARGHARARRRQEPRHRAAVGA